MLAMRPLSIYQSVTKREVVLSSTSELVTSVRIICGTRTIYFSYIRGSTRLYDGTYRR